MIAFALSGPLSISIWGRFSILFLVISLLCNIIFYKKYKPKPDFLALLVVGPIFLYLVVGYFSFSFFSLAEYDSYIEGIIVRLLNYSLLLLNLVAFYYVALDRKVIILKYTYYVSAFFVFGGLWQFISFVTSPSIFPFETRSWLHGASVEGLTTRVTSFTREPNFFAPLIIEFLVLTYVLYNNYIGKLLSLLAIAVGLLTLSGGFYVHLLAMCLVVFFVGDIKIRTKIKTLLLIVVSIFLIYLFATHIFDSIIDYLNQKMTTESTGDSTRAEVQLGTIEYFFSKSNYFNLLFGHGFGSMMFTSDLVRLNGTMADDFQITNNLYIDYLWEIGIIGVISCVLSWLVALFLLLRRGDIYGRGAFLLLTSVMLSSLYRSEYVGAHYFVTIFCILVLVDLSKKNPKNE